VVDLRSLLQRRCFHRTRPSRQAADQWVEKFSLVELSRLGMPAVRMKLMFNMVEVGVKVA